MKEIPFAQNLTIQRTFDEKGRVVTLQEGEHTTQFAYNSSDELIEKTDYLGLKTTYLYHPAHHQVTCIEKDPTFLEITHDDFGREIARKDAYGATTLTEPNSYGDPRKIIYPDGGEETFTYAPNRALLSVRDPDGLETFYTYDPLKRPLSKRVHDRTMSYRYDAYQLLEEKDPSNVSTYYEYNLAGQKIKETRNDRTLRFSYDALGFLSKKENGSRWISYQNDVLGRTLSKSIDGKLSTFYTYDPAGNISSITKKETTSFVYDPYNRLIETKDPLGAQTTIHYEEGDKVFKKIIKDPKGDLCIELYNAHGLILRKEVPDCTLQEFSYDRALRLASHDHSSFTYTPEGRKASFKEADQRTTCWTYTPGGKVATKTKPDGTTLFYQYTLYGELAEVGSRKFEYDLLSRLVKGTGFSRDYDGFGNIVREEFGGKLSVETGYDSSGRPLQRILPDASRIEYEYDGPFLIKVYRYGPDATLLYTHSYNQFDLDGNLLEESGYFTTSYRYDKAGRCTLQTSPYFLESLSYDVSGNLIQKGPISLAYDPADQLIRIGDATFNYDKHSNRIAHNDTVYPIDPCNQLSQFQYNANGCLVFGDALFDEFDQPISLGQESITYDALGRRLQKGDVYYLYFGEEEVGAFDATGHSKELQIPGLNSPIAIEIESKFYYPVLDVQNIIRKLIDPETKKICQENNSDSFGLDLNLNIPYAYLGKRADANTGLIYFGKRYYIPSLGRWLTPDPLETIDHSNLYQYVFNNPYRFRDPNGESIGGYLLGLGEICLGGAIVVGGLGLEFATWGGFTFGVGITTSSGLALMGHGLALTAQHAQDISFTRNSYSLPATNDGYVPQSICGEDQLLIDRGLMERMAKEKESNKRHTPDQEAISDLVKGSGKKGVSNADADTLLDWAEEYNFPHRDDRGKWNAQGQPHWEGGEHIHLGPGHVKVN
jgi:RHS repeat-associated protein